MDDTSGKQEHEQARQLLEEHGEPDAPRLTSKQRNYLIYFGFVLALIIIAGWMYWSNLQRVLSISNNPL
ncbi:MAG: hypothetical protein Alpg2KO_01500 [Alphaproteobacteria bacterium]